MTTEITVTQGFGAAKRLDDGRYRIIVSGEAEADLVMRAPELLEENEALKDRIADLESEAEVVSAEFEGEMWKGVRSVLLDDCGWSADCFPATADNAIQGLREEMRHRGEEVVRLKDRIAELEAEKKWLLVEKERFLNAIDPTGQLRRGYQFQDSSYGPTTKIREKE